MPSVNTRGKTGGEDGRQVRSSQRRNQAVTRETDWVKDTTKHRETTVWRRQKSIIRKKVNDRVEHRQEHPMILLSDSLTAYRTQSETTRLLTFISEMWWLHGVHFSCSDLCASCKVELEPCEAVRQIHDVLRHVVWKTLDLPLSRLCPVHWNRTSRTEWIRVLDLYSSWRTFGISAVLALCKIQVMLERLHLWVDCTWTPPQRHNYEWETWFLLFSSASGKLVTPSWAYVI